MKINYIDEKGDNVTKDINISVSDMNKAFQGCTSLKTVDTSLLDFYKCSRMVMLDKMSFNQIEWCKDKGIIENLKPEVAKELNMCAFYALIPSDLINEFDSL